MCTVSWSAAPGGAGGYRLLFNRDEQRTREAASAPAHSPGGGTAFLAPRDGQAGGSWLAVNELGVAVGLLNHYAAEAGGRPADGARSRGLLVLELASCPSVAGFDARVAAADATADYRPFLIFAIDPVSPLSLWRWDGGRLGRIAAPRSCFLTTSSFETEAVLAERQRHRDALGDTPGDAELRHLHEQHDPDRPAHSIRMRRPDAQTVSYSEIEVPGGGGEIHFLYRPEPDGGLGFLPPHESSLPTR